MTDRNPDEYSTRAEVAQMLGVSTATLRNMERAGTGPKVVRFSERVALYPALDLCRYLAARSRGGVA